MARSFLSCIILALPLLQRAWAADNLQPAVSHVTRADGSRIELQVYLPPGGGTLPIVLAIDGSMCFPSTSGFIEFLRTSLTREKPFALVVVEKPGPTPLPPPDENGNVNIGPEFRCSEEFKQYYSVDQCHRPG